MVYNGMNEEEFCDYVESTVKETIKKFKLFTKKEKLLIAVSGGKDSQVSLYILHKLGYKPDALLIDEGIANYREHTIPDMENLCKKFNTKLTIESYKKEYGFGIDTALKKKPMKPCTICGTFRRSILNKHAQNYDKLITGHNLDDESQAIVMNLLSSHLNLLPRLGPKSSMYQKKTPKGLTPRVKPLYFIKEKEIRLYAFLKKLEIYPGDCPYSPQSFRAKVQDWLNERENNHPGTKRNIVDWFIKNYEKITKQFVQDVSTLQYCKKCGQPSQGTICKTCTLKEAVCGC